MIKGIIFDLDGVLMDSLFIWKEIGKRIVRSYGKTPEENLGDILFPMSFTQAAEYMISTYNLEVSVDEIIRNVKQLVEDFYFYEVETKAGAKELVNTLSEYNIEMNIATTSNKVHVTKALERNGIMLFFNEVITVDEIGKSKHEPDIYLKAAECLGYTPKEIAVFEDSLVGAETAKKAGFFVVGVYDSLGEVNQEGLRKISDVYVESYDKLDVEKLLKN